MMTMLELIQAATGELGLPVPTYVAGNPNRATVQQLALLNSVGRNALRGYMWQWQQIEHRFYVNSSVQNGNVVENSNVISGLADTSQFSTQWMLTGNGILQDTYITNVVDATTIIISQPANGTYPAASITFCQTQYDLPSDYDHTVPRTHWDKSKHWEMLGPETQQQWEWLKSSYISTGPRIRWMISGNTFQIWPIIDTDDFLGFNYISNGWAFNAGDTRQTSLVADTDYCIYPDAMMITGLKYRYFEIKGFDTTDLKDQWTEQLLIARAQDASAPTLSMAPRLSNVLIDWSQIPDSGYGA
jgi:hypothetical protein